MMSFLKVGFKNVPIVFWLFSLTLLIIQAGPALAANQYTLNCVSCHGMPPLDSAQRDVVTGAFQGNHQTHLPATALPNDCVKCHNNNAYTIDHYNGGINMAARINNYSAVSVGAARYGKPIFFNQTSRPVLATCSNVNCHFESATGSWGGTRITGGPGDCNLCHAFPPATGQSGTGHSVHTSYLQAQGQFSVCDNCHGDHRFEAKPYQHATSAGHRPIYTMPALKYTGTATKYLPSQAQAGLQIFGRCSNTYCHSNGNPTPNTIPARTVAFKMMTTPVYGTTTSPNDCGICHAAKPTTNAHSAHIVKASLGCEVCHSTTASNSTTILSKALHVNTVKDVSFTGAAAGTVWSGSTCTTSYCHSNGATPPVYQTASWTTGTTLNCSSCHPTLSGAHTAHVGTLLSTVTFYNYTANKSAGSELTANTYYAFGCANCHPTDPSLHANGVLNVVLTPSAAGGTLKAKNAAGAAATGTPGSNITCSGVYCHSNGQSIPTYVTAPNWYGGPLTGDKCAACHGNSPTTGAHAAHVVGIHSDDIYNGTSGKLATAAAVGTAAGHGDPAQSTTLSCNICHNTTISVAYNDKNLSCSTASCHDVAPRLKGNAVITNRAVHVNGKADLAFYSAAAVKSKAQLRDSAFTNYTAAGGFWNRTTYKAGAASTDTAKLVLSNTMYSAGNCSNVACHNGRTVNWTTDVGKGKECAICHSKL